MTRPPCSGSSGCSTSPNTSSARPRRGSRSAAAISAATGVIRLPTLSGLHDPKMTNVVTRFAPSPTGRLHVCNVRTAVHNWLWARKNNGRFLLRMDDTDAARSTEAFAQGIRADLDWLGMTPDDEGRSEEQTSELQEMFGRLVASGRILSEDHPSEL